MQMSIFPKQQEGWKRKDLEDEGNDLGGDQGLVRNWYAGYPRFKGLPRLQVRFIGGDLYTVARDKAGSGGRRKRSG